MALVPVKKKTRVPKCRRRRLALCGCFYDRKQLYVNKDTAHQTKRGGEKKNQKACTSVIYELKEVHYLLEEAQTKTQTE